MKKFNHCWKYPLAEVPIFFLFYICIRHKQKSACVIESAETLLKTNDSLLLFDSLYSNIFSIHVYIVML